MNEQQKAGGDQALAEISRELRLDILKMFYKSQAGHLAPALSCLDILTVLYFGGLSPEELRSTARRDRVILSKGHASAALYAVLARAGYFPRAELLTFYQNGSRLGGHPSPDLPGVECATGSLGHGLGFATGTALAAGLDGLDYHSYVVMGDGECQEGSVWEAAMFAANQRLDNLTAIVDRNGLQGSNYVDEIAPLGALDEKWRAFGWDVAEVDGHDCAALALLLKQTRRRRNGRPLMVAARTTKGKGLALAENQVHWHSRAPKGAEWDAVCAEYGLTLAELDSL